MEIYYFDDLVNMKDFEVDGNLYLDDLRLFNIDKLLNEVYDDLITYYIYNYNGDVVGTLDIYDGYRVTINKSNSGLTFKINKNL